MHGYEKSETGKYVLTRDGRAILVGTEQECWAYIHERHCYSVDHAIRWEGYSIQPKDS